MTNPILSVAEVDNQDKVQRRRARLARFNNRYKEDIEPKLQGKRTSRRDNSVYYDDLENPVNLKYVRSLRDVETDDTDM